MSCSKKPRDAKLILASALVEAVAAKEGMEVKIVDNVRRSAACSASATCRHSTITTRRSARRKAGWLTAAKGF